MSNHPVNLGLRFLLELGALFGLGYWGWTQHEGAWRLMWGIGLPLLAAAVWGIFRVPGEPGPAPVAVPGGIRLLIELAVFGGGAWGLYAAGQEGWALAFVALLLAHHLASYERIVRMVRRT